MKIRTMSQFLDELEEKRIKSLSIPADTPRIGLFWLHLKDSSTKIFFSIVETLDFGEDFGNFIVSGKGHFAIWDSLTTNNFAPKNSDYTDLPRGRVAYHKDKKQYFVFLGKWISSMPGIKKVIKSEFKLKSNTRWEADIHYQQFKRWGF